MGRGWTGKRAKRGNKRKRKAGIGKRGGKRYKAEGKVRDRVQRGVDRRKSRKKDVQGRSKRLHAQALMEICFL